MDEKISSAGVRASTSPAVKQRRLQAPQSNIAPVRRVVAPTLSAAIVYNSTALEPTILEQVDKTVHIRRPLVFPVYKGRLNCRETQPRKVQIHRGSVDRSFRRATNLQTRLVSLSQDGATGESVQLEQSVATPLGNMPPISLQYPTDQSVEQGASPVKHSKNARPVSDTVGTTEPTNATNEFEEQSVWYDNCQPHNGRYCGQRFLCDSMGKKVELAPTASAYGLAATAYAGSS